MEMASDIFVLLGTVLVIAALGWIWWPLGLIALGLAMILLGYVFHVKNALRKAADLTKGK